MELSAGQLLAPEDREKGDWRDLDVVEEKAVSWVSSAKGPKVELDLKSRCYDQSISCSTDDQVARSTSGVPVIHHYGHGGCGFSTSWGTAERAVGLVHLSDML